MKAKDQSQIQERFGERVSFDKTEMLLYSHDTASLPNMIKQIINTVPEAVVQPVDTDDVVFISRFAREKGIPITRKSKDHLVRIMQHHGLSIRKILLIVYAGCVFFGLSAVLLKTSGPYAKMYFLGIAIVVPVVSTAIINRIGSRHAKG